VKRTDSALVTGILVMALLYFAREVFIPLALAGLLTFFLAPAAIRLERWGVRRIPAALLVIFLSLSAVGALGWILLGQIYSLAVELPQYQQNISDKIGSLHLDSAGRLSRSIEMLTNLHRQIKSGSGPTTNILPMVPRQRTNHSHTSPPTLQSKTNQPVAVRIEEPEESMLQMARRTMVPLLHPLTTTFIVAIFLAFFLAGREDLRDRGLRLAGSGRMHLTTTAIEDATRRVSRYLQMQLIVNLCYGAVVGTALGLIGVPHPLLWAALTCVLRFVPYVGIMMAAAGPLLLSAAISQNWNQLIWTAIVFGVLEIVAANFIEPVLYSASTGISAIAVLIAAVFWTFLWGLPGLLLSTPLTVCLIVIGRQVPRLRYLEVLFGERTGLPPSEHFYQRMLAGNLRDATALIEGTLKTTSKAEVYDSILLPALSMIGEARRSGEMTPSSADEMVQTIQELVEELAAKDSALAPPKPFPAKRVLCLPARDFADEVACQLAEQVLSETAPVRVMSAGWSVSDLAEPPDGLNPDVLCVVGIPPRPIGHIKLRCHQIHARFPEAVVVACALNKDTDLSSLRSRIPIEDAQHVVCSQQLMLDYLTSLFQPPAVASDSAPEAEVQPTTGEEAVKMCPRMQQMDLMDGPEERIFDRLVTDLARSFEAPIALIMEAEGKASAWEAQCGLPEEALKSTDAKRDLSIFSRIVFSEPAVVISDTEEDERFANNPFVKEKGIRFFAGAQLKAQDGKVLGSICVLDTRPRQLTDQQKETLISIADSVVMAIELRESMKADELTGDERVVASHK
jgi:predicted PurR-regulated permease PerM